MEHCEMKRVKEQTSVVEATYMYIQHGIIERVHCWFSNSGWPGNVHLLHIDAYLSHIQIWQTMNTSTTQYYLSKLHTVIGINVRLKQTIEKELQHLLHW